MRALPATLLVLLPAVGLLGASPGWGAMATLPAARLPAAADMDVPVILDKHLRAGDVRVTLAFAQRGDVPVDRSLFGVPEVLPPKNASQVAVVRLSATNLPAGVYTVGLQFEDIRTRSGIKPLPPEVQKLEVVQAGAHVGLPPKVTMVCPGGCDGVVVPVILRETSKGASVSGLSLRWALSDAASGQETAATVECARGDDGASVTLPAGGQVELDCLAKRNGGAPFPLGTTTGLLSVVGEPLTDVASIPVEIRVTRAAWSVPLLIALGVLGGFLVRVVLDGWLKRSELRDAAEKVRRELTLAQQASKDPQHSAKLLGARDNLVAAAHSKGSDLKAAITTAQDAKTKADDELAALFKTVLAELEEREKFVLRPWTLPALPQRLLEEIRAIVEDTRAALETGNVSQAAKRLKERGPKEQELALSCATWAAQINGSLDGLTARDQEELTSASGDAFERLRGITQEGKLEDTVATCGDVMLLFDPLIKRRMASLPAELEKAISALNAKPLIDPKNRAREALHASLLEVQKATSFENRLEALGSCGRSEAVLQTVLEDAAAILAVTDEVRKSVLTKIGSFILARHYEDAINAVVTPKKHLAGESHTPDEAAKAPSDNSPAPTTPAADLRKPISPTGIIVTANQALVASVHGAVTIFAGLGVVALGTVVFLSNFIGYPKEIVELLAWGFTANVSIDALLIAATRLRPSA